MIRDLPNNSNWSAAGIGNFQFIINSVAIVFGGGVCVGLEDNIWFEKKRTKLATNYDLIKRIHETASANERKINESPKTSRQAWFKQRR